MGRLDLRLPTLHPGQVDIDASTSRFKMIVAGRRFGKTRYATRSALRVALGDRWWQPDNHQPGRAWWVAPTYKVTNEGWEPLVFMARQIPGSTVEIGERRITLPNGGVIEIRSADNPETLVGAGLDLVVLDEAGTMQKKAWKESLRPTLSDRRGGAIFIGTPKGYNWLWDEWNTVPNRPAWARFHKPTWENPLIHPDEIEEAKIDLGSILFAQEYGAEFVDISGGIFHPPFPTFDRLVMTSDGPDPQPEIYYLVDGKLIADSDCRRIVVIDPAVSTKTSADYTAIATVAFTPTGEILVLDMDRERREGPDIIPTAAKKLAAWNASEIGVETVAFQLSLFQEARRKGLPVRKIQADKDKTSRALPLSARFEARQVFFLSGAHWIDDLSTELLVFPNGGHDDQVDALAYAATEAGRSRSWAAY